MNNPQAIERQIQRLKKYLPQGVELNLNARSTYFSQRDNQRDQHRTCNSSSNAMYVDWLLRATGKSGLETDNEYVKAVFRYGDTIYHQNQDYAIKDFGFDTKWMVDADVDFLEDLVDTGFPVVCNILHRGSIVAPRGGHIIMLIARADNQYWIAHDPYGTFESGYTNPNGAYSRIPNKQFLARWQGGYRILR